ncbi:MAG: hypothetical protein WKF94_07135 [Solirubrobacteraceae bacterium]
MSNSRALPFFEQKKIWPLEELRSRFERDWRFWQEDVRTRPVRLPEEIVVQPVLVRQVVDSGVVWEIRGTEVAAVDSEHTTWVPFR